MELRREFIAEKIFIKSALRQERVSFIMPTKVLMQKELFCFLATHISLIPGRPSQPAISVTPACFQKRF